MSEDTNDTPNPQALKVALDYLKAHMVRVDDGKDEDWDSTSARWQSDRYLFPLRKKSGPLIKDNLAMASNDPAQIIAWAKQFPHCWWGIAAAKSGLIPVDIDVSGDKQGAQSVKTLKAEGFTFPPTEKQRSPSGGWHLVYRGRHRFTCGGPRQLGMHIDVPNYVVLGGCGEYRSLGGETVDAPKWIVDKIWPEETEEGREHARQRRERGPIGDPVPLDLFKTMLEASGYRSRHSYGDWLNFAMMCHEAAGGDSADYLAAFVEWSANDPNPDGSRPHTWGDWDSIERHWLSFNEERKDGLTRGSWFKALKVEGHGDLVADEAAKFYATNPEDDFDDGTTKEYRDDPLNAPVDPPALVRCHPGLMHQMVRKAQRYLIKAAAKPGAGAADQIFQRGGVLVHLNRNRVVDRVADKNFRVDDQLLMVPVTVPWLTDRLGRAMLFEKFDGRMTKWKPVDPPGALVTQLMGLGSAGWKFPTLLGTVEAPTLRQDGSLLQTPGYDGKSKLYFDPGHAVFPTVQDRPTKVEAKRALKMLSGILIDFPFVDEDGIEGLSKSVALAALLTSVCRRSLAIAPMFGFDANEVESGKTLLAQLPAILMTGRRTGERPFSDREEEREKRLSAALDGGDPIILFDNVDCPIEGGSLCGVITDEVMQTRRLGSNTGADQITAPTNALIEATGNKLTAAGDMTARMLICRIVPEEKLSARAAFAYPQLDEHVIEHRPALVTAALTVLRGYIAAGRPMKNHRNRFHQWRLLVADAVTWLGEVDPCAAFARAQEADPVREAQLAVIRAWAADIGNDEVTTADALRQENVTTALADATRMRVATTTGAAKYLKGMVGVRLGGCKLCSRFATAKHAATWWLEGDPAAMAAEVIKEQTAEAEQDFNRPV